MNHLARELAPIGEAAWHQISDEAKQILTQFLAARRLVDFSGPVGWEESSIPTGRLGTPEDTPAPLVDLRPRQAYPFLELRRPFRLDRSELNAAERGANDVDLSPVTDAARSAAYAEDWVIFHSPVDSAHGGIIPSSPFAPREIGTDFGVYPHVVAQAVADLRDAGVTGPYGLALGSDAYQGVVETTENNGYPLLKHLRTIVDGPVVWTPAVDGAVVLSLRGGDYEFVSGEDFSIGYAHHDAESVELYLEASFAFRVLTPEAAVPLVYTG